MIISANDDNKKKIQIIGENIRICFYFKKKVLSLYMNDIIRVTTMSLKNNSEA